MSQHWIDLLQNICIVALSVALILHMRTGR